jgi:FKBP-type peptidyl-prolyl cis-trans isomerase FkpA
MLSACKKKNTGCDLEAGNTTASAQEEGVVTAYIAANSIIGAVELENSGLYYLIETAGNLNKPNQCSRIQVQYKGMLENGNVFDETSSNNSAIFSLNSADPRFALIEGWRRGLPLIGEGGKIKLLIPSSMGYGTFGSFNSNTGVYTIPPNAMIIFDISLEKIL